MGRALRLATMGVPVGGGGAAYAGRILQAQPGDLIGYWIGNNAAGPAVTDSSPYGHTGTATAGVTFGATGMGDGNTALAFDGDTDTVDIYSASLASVFNGNEGTLLTWWSVASGAVADAQYALTFRANSSNQISLYKHASGAGTFVRFAGGVTKTLVFTITNNTPQCIALRWSVAENDLRLYINGILTAGPITTIGTFAGTLDSGRVSIGASSNTGGNTFLGTIAHVALWKAPLPIQTLVDLADF